MVSEALPQLQAKLTKEMDAGRPPAVVFDIGSQNFRAGVADLESEVPTHELHQMCDGSSTGDASWPIERGQVVNWANMEALLAKMYYQQLQLVPEGPTPPPLMVVFVHSSDINAQSTVWWLPNDHFCPQPKERRWPK